MDDWSVEPPSWGNFLDRYRAAREAAAATLSPAAPPNTSPSSAPTTPRGVPASSALPPPSLSLQGSPQSAPASPSSSAASPPPASPSSPRRVAMDKNVWGPVFHPLGRSVHTAKRYDGVAKPPGSGESTSELHDKQKLFSLYPQEDDE